MTLHGTPAQTVPSGMLLLTKLPAPIITLFPISTSYKRVVLAPIKTLLPILISPIFSLYIVPPPRYFPEDYSTYCVRHRA